MKMCETLAAAGHTVTLIAIRGDKDLNPFTYYGTKANFAINSMTLPPLPLIGRLYPFYGYLKGSKIKADIYYTRNIEIAGYLRRAGKNFRLELHSPFTNTQEKKILTRCLNSPSCEKIIVITHALKKFLSEEMGIQEADTRKIVVVPDAASPTATEPAVSKTGKTSEIGYVGQLHAGKGAEVVIALAKRLPEKQFHIVGGTEAQIKSLSAHAPENVRFHGQLPYRDAEKIRLACDILLAPYQEKVATYGNSHDNIAQWMSPLKLFEYMAARKAIVCSDVQVLREVMRDGVNCLLVPHDTIDAWVEAVNRLEDSSLREKLANAAYSNFIHDYTWAARAKKVLT